MDRAALSMLLPLLLIKLWRNDDDDDDDRHDATKVNNGSC